RVSARERVLLDVVRTEFCQDVTAGAPLSQQSLVLLNRASSAGPTRSRRSARITSQDRDWPDQRLAAASPGSLYRHNPLPGDTPAALPGATRPARTPRPASPPLLAAPAAGGGDICPRTSAGPPRG